jgi:peptide chain release factor subunit 1
MASASSTSSEEELELVEHWKLKRIIQQLDKAEGNGTSMVSLIIRGGDKLSDASSLLTNEFGTAVNIKSRVNRQSVLSAITAAQQRLKLYNRIPPNGLVVFCGTASTADGKERMISIDFEPFKPVNTSLYWCGDRFRTEALGTLLQQDDTYGFIIVDGNGALYGTLSGNNKVVLHSFSVDLPKKHNKGGQSSVRFGRLRIEKRHAYLRKVAEGATMQFITDNKVNVTGLILAGSAEFKTALLASDMFDPRLVAATLKTVDIAYGGESGFQQAIDLAKDCLVGVKFLREKKLISRFMTEISQDTGKYCFGAADTMAALEQGAVEDLILFEDLDLEIRKLKDPKGGDAPSKTIYVKPAVDSKEEILERTPFLDWISENYRRFGARLTLVTDKSSEGAQFCRGFSGVGGILRYPVDFALLDVGEVEETEDDFFI